MEISKNVLVKGDNVIDFIVPDGIKRIENCCFIDCNKLKTIKIPQTVYAIGVSAFEYCSKLEKINIPDSIKAINDRTFYGCYNLTEITIPDSIKSIEFNSFEGCDSLKTVYCNNPKFKKYFENDVKFLPIPNKEQKVEEKENKMEQEVTIKVQIPVGYKFVRYGIPKNDELYLSGKEVRQFVNPDDDDKGENSYLNSIPDTPINTVIVERITNRASLRCSYYYLEFNFFEHTFSIKKIEDLYSLKDDERYNSGNYFLSIEEAEKIIFKYKE